MKVVILILFILQIISCQSKFYFSCHKIFFQKYNFTDIGIENEGNIMKELKQLMKELNDMIQDLESGVKQNGDKLDQIIDNQGISDNFEYTT